MDGDGRNDFLDGTLHGRDGAGDVFGHRNKRGRSDGFDNHAGNDQCGDDRGRANFGYFGGDGNPAVLGDGNGIVSAWGDLACVSGHDHFDGALYGGHHAGNGYGYGDERRGSSGGGYGDGYGGGGDGCHLHVRERGGECMVTPDGYDFTGRHSVSGRVLGDVDGSAVVGEFEPAPVGYFVV